MLSPESSVLQLSSFWLLNLLRGEERGKTHAKEQVPTPEKSDWQIMEEALTYNDLQFKSDSMVDRYGQYKSVLRIYHPDHPNNTSYAYQIEEKRSGGANIGYICKPTYSRIDGFHARLAKLCSAIRKINPSISIEMSDETEY